MENNNPVGVHEQILVVAGNDEPRFIIDLSMFCFPRKAADAPCLLSAATVFSTAGGSSERFSLLA